MKTLTFEEANGQNRKDELESMNGVTLGDYFYIDVEDGSFLAFEVSENGRPKVNTAGEKVYLLISRDAELNGGGYIGWIGDDFC
tara:strand:+ start:487 stop:738 length:252 start_codon:yes stop_codon:yes gene_type:complete